MSTLFLTLALIGSPAAQTPKTPTSAEIVKAITSLAQRGTAYWEDKSEAAVTRRVHLSKELLRLNKCSEESVRKACEQLEAPIAGSFDEHFFEKSFICQLWFILRYRPTSGKILISDEYDLPYHYAFVPPSQMYPENHALHDSYDYPWNREAKVWRIMRFGYRLEGGFPSPLHLYKHFSKLPRRIGI